MQDTSVVRRYAVALLNHAKKAGTVDAVTRFLFEQGCYVTEHHSFDDRLSGRFFIRVEFRQPDGFDEQSFRAGLAERGGDFADAGFAVCGQVLQQRQFLVANGLAGLAGHGFAW